MALHVSRRSCFFIVMAGLVPAIHVLASDAQDVDARDKPGHDGELPKAISPICDSPTSKGG